MAKTLDLTIGERVAAVKILNEFKGDLETLAVLLDDVKKFSVSEDEWSEANLTKTPSDEEISALDPEVRATTQQTWKWDETHTKEIELEDRTATYLKSKIDEKSTNNEVTLADVALITLKQKLA